MNKLKRLLFLILLVLICMSFTTNFYKYADLAYTGVFDGKSFYKKPRIVKEIDTYENYLYNPIIYNETIIKYSKVDDKQKLQCYYLNTYDLKWELEFDECRGLQMHNDLLYFRVGHIESRYIYCVNPNDGKIIWKSKGKYNGIFTLTFYKDQIIYSSGNRLDPQYVVFIDIKNGEFIKEKKIYFPDRELLSVKYHKYEVGVCHFIQNFTVYESIVIIHSTAYGYICYDIEKDKILWIQEGFTDSLGIIHATIRNDIVYMFRKNDLIALDLYTGERIFQIDDGLWSYSRFVVDEDNIYLLHNHKEDIFLRAHNNKTGKKIWETKIKYNEIDRSAISTRIYKIGDILYVPYAGLLAFDSKIGKQLWKHDLNFRDDKFYFSFFRGLTVYEDKMYIITDDKKNKKVAGKLYIMEEDDRNWFQKLIDNISKIFQ